MRKTFLLAIACLALALFVAAPATAQTLDFRYSLIDYGGACSNAETDGGNTTEIAYWQNYAVESTVETDWSTTSAHPQAGAPDTGLYARGASCATSFDSRNLDSANQVPAIQQIVYASIWADDGSGTGPLTHAAFPSAVTWDGYCAIYSGMTDAAGNLQILGGLVNMAPWAVGDYDVAGDASTTHVITSPNPDTGNTGWAHVEWTADPVGVVGAINSMGNVVRGYDVFRATTDPAASVPSDFALANAAGAVRSDGTTVLAGAAVDSGLASSGNLFFNDENSSAIDTVNANTHYAVTPVGVAGSAAALADGVRFYMEGNSWYPVGGKGAPPVFLPGPTSARLVSFSAKINERGDKVTLNWRTASEDGIIGFNIVRKFKLNGQDRGKAVRVNRNLIVAQGVDGGGADYSFVDSLRMPPQLKRARGLEISYELEVVSADGASSALGHSSLTPKLAR